ncbi:histidine--tRNA ligase [Floccifex sp.]|uniref:histidine--tRNA ligase n=1 Tax=Floccifex sp. TaxID=2815810 RepID=UPI003F0854BD
MAYQIPRGTADVYGSKSYAWQELEQRLRQFCFLYNYDEIRTPIFEHTNVFKRENDSSDMVNKEMYTFTLANSSTSLTLRPEGTAGVVRSFVENKMYSNPDLPVKLYYMGPMFRHERPQKGRMRIFNQFGVECLGNKSPYVDVETITLAFSILKSLGLKDIKVCLNTLGDDASRDAYRSALKEHFAPYYDELCSDCKRRFEQNPLRILDCKVDHDKEFMKNAPSMKDYLNEESKQYFETVCSLLKSLDIPYEVDDKLVRGLDYYTHTVFEIVSVNSSMGAQSTVLAGGRYDHLIPYFGGPEQMSGIGWALGMERILIALESEGILLEEKPGLDAFVMCLDKEAQTYAFEILTQLRANGFRADMDYLQRGFKGQFKAVARTQAKFAIIIGSTELENQVVSIKNIETQVQSQVPVQQIIEYLDKEFE